MALGTAGFTAALAVLRLEHNGMTPVQGPVAVTGATGGVGGIAIAILAGLGYSVTAITGKESEREYLQRLGATASPVATHDSVQRSPDRARPVGGRSGRRRRETCCRGW